MLHQGCKRLIKYAFKLCGLFVFCTTISVLNLSALASDTKQTDVNLTVSSESFADDVDVEILDVTVPTSLDITMDVDGVIKTPTSAVITNGESNAVEVTSILVTPADGWSVVDWLSADFENTEKDTKELSLSFRNDGVGDDDGSVVLSEDNWVIEASGSLDLNMGAKIPIQSEQESSKIATISFVIGRVETQSSEDTNVDELNEEQQVSNDDNDAAVLNEQPQQDEDEDDEENIIDTNDESEFESESNVQQDVNDEFDVQEDVNDESDVQQDVNDESDVQEDVNDESDVQEDVNDESDVQEDVNDGSDMQQDVNDENSNLMSSMSISNEQLSEDDLELPSVLQQGFTSNKIEFINENKLLLNPTWQRIVKLNE